MRFFGDTSAFCLLRRLYFEDDDPPEVAGFVTAFMVGGNADFLSGFFRARF